MLTISKCSAEEEKVQTYFSVAKANKLNEPIDTLAASWICMKLTGTE